MIYELNLLERIRGESRKCIPSHTHAQHTLPHIRSQNTQLLTLLCTPAFAVHIAKRVSKNQSETCFFSWR